MKKIFVIFIIISMVLVNSHFVEVDALFDTNVDTSIINFDYVDDHVIVVLNNEASLKFEELETINFNNVECKNIRELTFFDTLEVKRAVDEITKYVTTGNGELPISNVDISNYNRILCLELKNPGKSNVIKAIEILKKNPNVLYAEPDYYLTVPTVITESSNVEYQWAIDKIQLEDAWGITSGQSSVLVGIADTGIDFEHDNLTNQINVTLSRDFTSGGCVQGGLTDEYKHGTYVAGIVGAEANYSEGTSGVSPNVKLVSLKVQSAYSNGQIYGSVTNLVAAIDYARVNNIKIINASVQWNLYSDALEESLDRYTGLLICAAGNTPNTGKDNDLDSTIMSPAKCQNENIIVVGASTENDTRRSSSHWGRQTVDIFAPGEDIKTTDTNNGYITSGGTSLAAPHVAGVAALLLSAHPELTAAQIKSIILESADPVPAFANICVSGGRLNAYEALKTASIHQFSYTADTTGTSHTVSCTKSTCNYSYVEAHSLVTTNINNATNHRYTCTDCGYTTLAAHNYVVQSYTPNVHTLICEDCGYNYSSNHNMEIQPTASITSHNIQCTVCDYSYLENHNYYVLDYDDEDGDGIEDYRVWICNDCNFSRACEHNFSMRSEYDNQAHYHICQYCDHTITESHLFVTVSVNDVSHHQKVCACGYSYYQEHTWIDYSTYYKCMICNMTSATIPDHLKAIPPEYIEETE